MKRVAHGEPKRIHQARPNRSAFWVFDMPYCVYILESKISGILYKGHTSDLERRIREHNHPETGHKRYTRKQKGPWKLIYTEEYGNRSEAMKREKFFKSGQGRDWIKQNVMPYKSRWTSPPQAD